MPDVEGQARPRSSDKDTALELLTLAPHECLGSLDGLSLPYQRQPMPASEKNGAANSLSPQPTRRPTSRFFVIM